MKLPSWLKVEWSDKPTETGKTGCDGLYIEEVEIICPHCKKKIFTNEGE